MEGNMRYEGLLFVLAGLFTLAGAINDWDWFMTHRKAAFLNAIIGRNGTRVFYSIIGLGITIAGIGLTLGLLE
jgi:hypothetical protein